MKSLLSPGFIALILIALATFPELRSQVTKPSPAASAKPDRLQLEAQFKKSDSDRAAAKEKTKERADAAKSATQAASDIAWLAFDAGKFDEAASWFARSAELKDESYVHARGYWAEYLRTTAVETDGRIEGKNKELETQLATAEESKKETLRKLIHGFEKLRYTTRYNTISTLEALARENNDAESLLKYTQQELEIRRLEMTYLQKVSAPKEEINQKNAQMATALERVASAQADLAQFDQAEKNGLEALALRRALPEEMPERKLEDSLAFLSRLYVHNIGDLVKARDYYQQALASIEASTAVRKKALGEDRFYTPEQKAGMSKEELAKHEESEAQNRDMTIALDTMSQALALANLGGISQEQGDLKGALTYYDIALKLGEDLPKGGYINVFEIFRARIKARVLGDKASLHAESGEIELALKELDETVAIKRSIGQDDWTAQSLLQAADLAQTKGDMEKARHLLEQARQIFAAAHKLNSVVSATGFLAVIARDEGKLDEAATLAEQSLVLARKTGNLGAVSGAARTLASIRVKQNKLDEARTLIEEARVADSKTGSVGDRIGTLGISGEILEAKGDNEKALETYKEAVKLVESVRSTAASEASFADVKRNYRPYERIVRILIKLDRSKEAFDYLNRAKSKKLQDSMPPSILKSDNKRDQESLDKAAALEAKQKVTDAQLAAEQAKPKPDETVVKTLRLVAASNQAEYREVIEDITTANPDWEKSMTMKPLQLAETQEHIPDGVTFLQYAPLAEQLYIFVVTNKTVKIYMPQVNPEELKKKVLTVREQIISGESGAPGGPLTKNLCSLYDMLILPIEPELASVKTIAFIPNQILYYLPLQALAKKQADGKVRYLIEDKEIVYLTAADVMRAVQPPDPGKSKQGMVAFGNPTGANLPASEVEVKSIATVFPGTEVFSGAGVTKEAINSQQLFDKRIVHFATHGRLDSTRPRDSYLQLAAGGVPGAEKLSVREIWHLPMKKVEIVTLSACKTAVADKEPDGGEITTLAEAFATAKVRTVVASLWSVGDESTKEFMVAFYKQLAGGATKTAALQSAQLELMKNPKFSRPLYWAPFVLMGDWR
ncbi:MAG: CHAT domain-containing protein [Verrucomicrobiota bacterium]|nr:CHAT domain-containing protein [Verrucomicrobiota bacterium]